MFKLKNAFFGERSVTKVAGLFVSLTEAENAARALLDASALTESQVRLLGPSDGELASDVVLSRAIEPESGGIWRTLIRTHVTMGLLGVLAGVVLYLILMSTGNHAMLTTPGISFVAITGFGMLLGLMAGGALSIRPDHGRVVSLVRKALNDGGWAVIAHPMNADQTHQVVVSLRSGSERVVRSF